MRHRLAILVAAATFFLIFAGGMVTSTGTGLSDPGWPTFAGEYVPTLAGITFYEHGHRTIAGAVGMLTVALALALWRWEPRPWVRKLGFAAVIAVVVQAVLGGVTVHLKLPIYVSVSHAGLAQVFCALVTAIAVVTSPSWRRAGPALVLPEASPGRVTLRALTLATVVALYAQVLIGAVLRHKGAGLAIPDFPLSYGQVIPELRILRIEPAIRIAYIHRVLGVVVAALAMATAVVALRRHGRERAIARPALLLAALALAQVSLGAATVLTIRDPHVASAHVVGGAALLATSVALALRVRRHLRWPDAALRAARGPLGPRLRGYVELTKPRIAFLALVATAAGFHLGAPGAVDAAVLVQTLLGTALVGGGASALNQWLERATDARMARTAGRPLPTGRLVPGEALAFGLGLAVAGVAHLAAHVNLVAAAIALATLASYVLVYTPLKRRTSLATVVGAVPGALPPVLGWAAAAGEVQAGAWALFAIVFLWQLPHFLAIAWIYRDDYAGAGFPTLPAIDSDGSVAGRQIAVGCLALLPASLAPTLLGVAGPLYFLGAFALGLGFLGLGLALALARSRPLARRLFVGSVLYLPALLALMTLDKLP